LAHSFTDSRGIGVVWKAEYVQAIGDDRDRAFVVAAVFKEASDGELQRRLELILRGTSCARTSAGPASTVSCGNQAPP
jgi:hypothetical protein